MKEAKLLVPFVLLLAMWLLFMAIVRTKLPSNATGMAHAKHHATESKTDKPAMKQGGNGVVRHKNLLVTGCLLGIVTATILVGMLVLAFGADKVTVGQIFAFAVGAILYQGVFVMLFLAYGGSLVSGDVSFIGAFPAGTSWLLFGVYLMPYYFIVLYVVFFDRWFMKPENLEKFKALVAKYRPERKGDE